MQDCLPVPFPQDPMRRHGTLPAFPTRHSYLDPPAAATSPPLVHRLRKGTQVLSGVGQNIRCMDHSHIRDRYRSGLRLDARYRTGSTLVTDLRRSSGRAFVVLLRDEPVGPSWCLSRGLSHAPTPLQVYNGADLL